MHRATRVVLVQTFAGAVAIRAAAFGRRALKSLQVEWLSLTGLPFTTWFCLFLLLCHSFVPARRDEVAEVYT